MARKVSIADVARAAGVSPTTVSHALSGKRSVSEATRLKVQQIVSELNYRPDRIASGLRHQQTKSVALLVVDIANPYYPSVVRGATNLLAPAGYVSHIGNTDGVRDGELELLYEMAARRVDGVIINPLATTVEEIREILGMDLPLVVLGQAETDPPLADHVWTDDAHGIAEAVQHLVGRNIHDIGFVSGSAGLTPGADRLEFFVSAMQAAGLEVNTDWIGHGDYTREGGRAAASELLDLSDRPRAILCANDLIAIGVLDAARDHDQRVPLDLSVIGFDNIETAGLISPGLTTVDNPAKAVGEACGRALLDRLAATAETPFAKRSLTTKLVVRESA